MKVVISLVVVYALVTAVVQASIRERQSSCDVTSIPDSCQIKSDINTAALVDPKNFLNVYCSEKCAQTLYDYYAICTPIPPYSAMLDFYCSSNEKGYECLLLLGVECRSSISRNCIEPYINNGTCTVACQGTINEAYSILGCCLFSYIAVTTNEAFARFLFDLCGDVDKATFCIGGVTNQSISFATSTEVTDSPTVTYNCDEFITDVDESCRHHLNQDIITTSATIDLDDFCDEPCGRQIYEFFEKCDEKTGTNRATRMDVFCAVNANGERCGKLTDSLDDVGFSNACQRVSSTFCPFGCGDYYQRIERNMSCCFASLIEVGIAPEGDVQLAINNLVNSCNVDKIERCEGHFTGSSSGIHDKTVEFSTVIAVILSFFSFALLF